MGVYFTNSLTRLTATFIANATSLPIDPTDVTLRVRDPNGTVAVYSLDTGDIIKDGTGSYHFDLEVLVAGHWHYRWEGSSPSESSNESGFTVRPSKVIL